jgi:YVTN family beta-propeller protein
VKAFLHKSLKSRELWQLPMNFFSKTVRLSALVVLGAVLIFEVGCGDTFRPIASPIPQPGGDPSSLDNITIINCNGTTSRTGPLTSCAGTLRSNSQQINVSGDSITSSVDIGPAPGYVSFDATRANYYVPNTSFDTITSIAITGTPTTLTVPVGSNPIASAVGTSEEYILNAGSGSVAANLSVIGIGANAVSATFPIGTAPSFALLVGNNLFVLDRALNQVNVYSTQQQKFIGTIGVGTTPVFAVASFDSNFLYVINQGSSDISIIDANALTEVARVSSGGSGPIKAVLDRSLIRLYVVNQASNSVTGFSAINNSSLTPLGSATVGSNPIDVTVLTGGNRAFAANADSNTITEINTGSFATKTLTVGADASAKVTDVASSSDGTKIFVSTVTTGNLANGVTVIRASDDVVVNNLLAPRQDPACVTSTASPCPLQQPQQFIGGK